MNTIKTKILIFSALLALFLSGSACNLSKVAADGNSANNSAEPASNNSSAENLSASNTAEQKPAEVFTSQTVAGIYHYKTYKPNKGGYDNTLEITDKGSGKLQVALSGSYMRTVDGEETMHEASGEGDAQLTGNTAVAKITPDGDDQSCRVTLDFTATNQVKVTTAKNCNFNVALDGLYIKEKTASTKNQTKTANNQPANLKKISYSQLEDFINDFQKNKTGMHFIITDVPAEKISKTERADTNGNKNFKGLYYFQIDDNDTNVATAFIGSTALYKDYVAKVEYEPAKLRVTAVIVEFPGEFDVYRSAFVIRIEGLEEDGKVVWTINGTEPTTLKIRQ